MLPCPVSSPTYPPPLSLTPLSTNPHTPLYPYLPFWYLMSGEVSQASQVLIASAATSAARVVKGGEELSAFPLVF